MTVVGVDPGKYGALAWLSDDGSLRWVADMPIDTEVSPAGIAHLMRDQGVTTLVAVVEQVSAFPKNGSIGNFKLGVAYGKVLGVLGAMSVPVHTVTPSHWKRGMGVTKDKGSSRQKATELWPAWAGHFTRAKDDGRAEAALIARWWIDRGSRA